MLALIDPLVQNAATTQAINEAWGMIALLTVLALLCVPFARRMPPAVDQRAAAAH